MSETENVKDTTPPGSQNSDNNGDKKDDDAEVHSANAWEKADLGDDERKSKFLRLMGAGKKAHSGRFVIGDHNPEHPRNGNETDQLQHQLEDQYTHSMQHRLAGGRHGHIGLGYHDADLDAKPPEEGSEPAQNKVKDEEGDCEEGQGGGEPVDDGKKAGKKDSKGEEEEEEEEEEGAGDGPSGKRESAGCDDNHDASPAEKKMKLVKSSS